MTMAAPPPPARSSKFNYYGKHLKEQCEGKLLSHQSEALHNLEEWFAPMKRNEIAVVSMPTGSGKTGIMCCLPYFLGDIGRQPEQKPNEFKPTYRFDKPILVIAPDLEIANQLEQQMLVAAADLKKQTFLIKRGIVPENDQANILPTGLRIKETLELKNKSYLYGKEIIITNVQKFFGDDWKKALPDNTFQMVIVDEAHHHPAQRWRDIVERFQGHALVVFFTATPYRADGKQVLDPLPVRAYHLHLRDAIKHGIIRQTCFHELQGNDPLIEGIELDTPPEDSDEVRRCAVILRRVATLQERKNEEMPLPDGISHMAIAIANNTDQADYLVQLWNRLYPSAPALAYHSSVPEHQRKKVMCQLKNNELKLVVVVAMLREGFDHPPISIAAITTKIVSPNKFVQFVGRAQRICRGKSTESNGIADIVTHEYYQQRQNYENFVNEALIPNDG